MRGSGIQKAVDKLPTMTEKIPIFEEKFLFFYQPGRLNTDLMGRFELVTGVRILGICFLFEALSSCIDIVKSNTFVKFIISILAAVLYAISAFYILYSTFNPKRLYIKIAYLTAAFIMTILLLAFLIQAFYAISCFLYPFNDDFLKLDFLNYLFGRGAWLFVYLYLVWILYCYMERSKGNGDINPPPENETLLNNRQEIQE